MKSLEELQNQYYAEFKGLPSSSPIVRNNQPNDAFELVVLKAIYGKFLPEFIKENISEIRKYIVAPPDNGIDIFYQYENGDESKFDIIQVKKAELNESQLRDCITQMERTIKNFIDDPKLVKSESCREILNESNLDKSNKNNCTYYVVHTGTTDHINDLRENERIITLEQLDILYRNLSEYVDHDKIHICNSVKYGAPEDNNGAIVCSVSGFDLAKLCDKYYSTEIGRNILFGSNLRESLITKKGKTYLSMSQTITECPDNFWYYNNGITIIAKDILEKENGTVELEGFSIVNGAQTTSVMQLFYKENRNIDENIAKLKKVSILTRILKIPDEKMRHDIAIYNNTQNPITSRDMVANRPEQRHLNEWLLDETYPQIYVEIRRGSSIPANFNKGIVHRKTTNEVLAQLLYASIGKPFTSKDKKKSLFNDEHSNQYLINQIYHDVFNYDKDDEANNGIVFKKSKEEIDELLFVQQLYKESKKEYKNVLSGFIDNLKKQREKAEIPDKIRQIDDTISAISLRMDTIGICLFYFIALYYQFKEWYDDASISSLYNYEKFYFSDKQYKKELINDVANLFLRITVDVLVNTANKNGKSGNISNWIRNASCEQSFLSALNDEMSLNIELAQKYKTFCEKYKA